MFSSVEVSDARENMVLSVQMYNTLQYLDFISRPFNGIDYNLVVVREDSKCVRPNALPLNY